MKRILLAVSLVSALLYAKSTTVTKIKTSEKKLHAVKRQQQQTSRRLEKIAKDIKKTEQEIAALDKRIDRLRKDQKDTEKEITQLKSQLSDARKALAKTAAKLEAKRKRFLKLLSERFSVVYAMEKAHEPTKKAILHKEVFRIYKQQNAKLLARLKADIAQLQKQKKQMVRKRNKTESALDTIVKKRDTFIAEKKKKERLLKRLAADEEKYTAKLQQIVDRQNALRNTLAQLNILRKQEVEEARKRAAARKEALRREKERKRRLRLARAKAAEKARRAKAALRRAKTEEARKKAEAEAKAAEAERKRIAEESRKVRNINASYKKEPVYAYRGNKTIPPIPGAKVVKRFGTYIDPIYKIKIFNESITLQAPHSPANVQNVLNGKVVFAGKTSMLGKVVVVAHGGKMHTVYAGLSKIAPTIRVGKKIKKGYVIGRVKRKLIFQATKNSKHINPLRLIRL